ncbi:MAG: hypothetical protein WDO73_25730 [Ignavibacteriota bacterium]
MLDGKGKYSKLTFDENQTQMVFLSDRDDQGAKPAKWRIYRWDRKAAAAELVSSATAGLKPGFAVSDKGALNFSRDGSRLYFGVSLPAAAPAPEAKTDDAADASSDERLWSTCGATKTNTCSPCRKSRRARSGPHLHSGLPDPRA